MQVYASVLAFLSISVPGWSTVVTRHLNTLLVVTFFTYVYRDLFPLATFNQHPLDIDEGWFLWTKFLIITTVGVFLPFFAPRGVSLDVKVCTYKFNMFYSVFNPILAV
jgi:hypothetical protein